MICSVCTRRNRTKTVAILPQLTGATTKSAPGVPDADTLVISGTWDFKWSPGTKIRVAFQQPRDLTDYDKARQRIQALASRWTEVLRKHLGDKYEEFEKLGVSLEFSPEWELGPALGADAPAGTRLKSEYLPSDPPSVDYDVLVSLDSLPLTRLDPFDLDPQRRQDRIVLPYSELGSYARRADYGDPTIFLGTPFEGGLMKFLNSNAGAHAVVHEFGHVLGLAHSHQNPRFKQRRYRPPEEIHAILTHGFQLTNSELDPAFVEQHFTNPWPGSLTYSDWREPDSPLSKLDSVMAHPMLTQLVTGDGAVEDLGEVLSTALAAPEERNSVVPTWPTKTDVDALVYMYEPTAKRTRTAQAAHSA